MKHSLKIKASRTYFTRAVRKARWWPLHGTGRSPHHAVTRPTVAAAQLEIQTALQKVARGSLSFMGQKTTFKSKSVENETPWTADSARVLGQVHGPRAGHCGVTLGTVCRGVGGAGQGGTVSSGKLVPSTEGHSPTGDQDSTLASSHPLSSPNPTRSRRCCKRLMHVLGSQASECCSAFTSTIDQRSLKGRGVLSTVTPGPLQLPMWTSVLSAAARAS